MSTRAKRARRLASLLTLASRVHVELRYQREFRAYSVIWIGGPSAEAMCELAVQHAADADPLDIGDLAWDRRAS